MLAFPGQVTAVILETGAKCKLQTLTIQRCQVDNECVNAIVLMMEHNTSLVSINVDHNDVRVLP